MKNEIRDYFFFTKEELDKHFGRELTTEDLDELREKIRFEVFQTYEGNDGRKYWLVRLKKQVFV